MNLDGLFTTVAGWKCYALAFALGAFAGGLAAGSYQGAVYGARIATIEKKQADEKAEQARAALAEIVRLSNIISGIDADYYKELQDAKVTNDKLRSDLRTGALRLRSPVSRCLSADGTSLGDGAATAELDGKTSEDLAAIAGDGDRAIVKLTACQAIVDAYQKQRSCKVNGGK